MKKIRKTSRLVVPMEPWLREHLDANTKQNKTASYAYQAIIEKMKRDGLLVSARVPGTNRRQLAPAYPEGEGG